MDVLGKIRRWHLRDGLSIREIAKKTSLSRNTVRKYLRDESVAPDYPVRRTPSKLDPFDARLTQWLTLDQGLPRKQRRTAARLFDGLKAAGDAGSYDRVTAFVRQWHREAGHVTTAVFIPLRFAPGEAFQFDWSTEYVVLGGQLTKLKVAHLRLSYSRKAYVRAYPSEAHEMLFDAHARAFAHFGGVPRRGIYDNMKTAVTSIGVGKARLFNRRFQAMASHYLFTPDACTPASGWEKGQVENQVGTLREWLFVPQLKFPDLLALNAWLERRCDELAAERPHPECRDQTIAAMFAREQPALGPLSPPFDGYTERLCRVSSQSLVHLERNRYSVPCSRVGQAVSIRIYADHLRVVAEGEVLAEHPRQFVPYQTLYDPWHYVPALVKKPGALRNGAPFVDWALPRPLKLLQARLMKLSGGDRQFVSILAAIPTEGAEAVAVACELALEAGVISAEYVLTTLHRLKATPGAPVVETPDGLRLKEEPQADMARYDRLLKGEIATLVWLSLAPVVGLSPAFAGVTHVAA